MRQTYSGVASDCFSCDFSRFLSLLLSFRSFLFLSFSLCPPSLPSTEFRAAYRDIGLFASVLLELGHGFRARGESLTLLSIQRRDEVTTDSGGGRGSPYDVRELPLSKIPSPYLAVARKIVVVARTANVPPPRHDRVEKSPYGRSDFIIISFSVSLFLPSLLPSIFLFFFSFLPFSVSLSFSFFPQAGLSKKNTWQSRAIRVPEKSLLSFPLSVIVIFRGFFAR